MKLLGKFQGQTLQADMIIETPQERQWKPEKTLTSNKANC